MPQHIKITVSRKTLFEDSFQQVIMAIHCLLLNSVCWHFHVSAWDAAILNPLSAFKDHELSPTRSEEEIVDHFSWRGRFGLRRCGQVIFDTILSNCIFLYDFTCGATHHPWLIKVVVQPDWPFTLKCCVSCGCTFQGMVLLALSWGSEPYVLFVWIRWQGQLLSADQSGLLHQPWSPQVLQVHRTLHCHGI